MTVSDTVIISIISAISGIIIAYLVNVKAKQVQAKKASKQPKDRMEQMFDGYERLIKQKDIEDDRKQKYIVVLELELQEAKKTIKHLATALETAADELRQSREDSRELRIKLDDMRKEYAKTKTEK